MKVLVVLALAVFTGCNADLMGMRAPSQQQLSMAKDAFWDYVAKATMTAEESVKQIRSSELGRDIDTLISESTEAVDRLTSSLRTQMAPVNQELIEQLSERAEVLKLQLQRVLSAVSSGLQPYTEELVDDLRRRVEELRREAAPVDAQALRTALLRTSQELRAQLERSSQELQAHMGPLSQELRQTVEQLQSRVMPLTQSLQEQMSQRSQEVQQILEPYTEELRAKVDAEAQNVRRQLEALWDSFARTRQ